MATPSPTPIHTHDCESCVFLGTFDRHDLYFCSHGPTVIARRSSDGPDYLSGLEFARLGIHPQLVEALARAKQQGLIK